MDKSPPPGGDVDLGPNIMAMFLTLSIIAFLVVLLRLGNRITSKVFGWDDAFAIISALCFLGVAAAVAYPALKGTYRPFYYLSEEQLMISLKLNRIADALVAAAAGSMKISIALLLLRLMDGLSKWRTWLLWTLNGLTAAITITTIFITFFQCQDPRAVWDTQLQASTYCFSISAFANEALFASAWYAFVDFALALYPVSILYGLHMSWRRKALLSTLLGLGIVTGIIASLKTALIPDLNASVNGSLEQFRLQVFVGVEIFALIVLGCVPVLARSGGEYITHIFESVIVTPIRRLISIASSASRTTHDPTGGWTEYRQEQNDAGGIALTHIKSHDRSSSQDEPTRPSAGQHIGTHAINESHLVNT